MLAFSDVYQMALQRVGSEEQLGARMPEVLTAEALAARGDDRFLSDMSRRIFQAGLSHQMVNNKWPAFEEAFFHFNPKRCAFISAEEIEERMRDARLIRHLAKMKSISVNAFMVDDISSRHDGFGRWLAEWLVQHIVELWIYLKKQGAQLGGMSGPRFLRMTGKDTFLLTPDVVAALVNHGVIDKNPTSMKALQEVQQHFNLWQEESGRPMAQISRILSLTVG